jgi:hypothetical protein
LNIQDIVHGKYIFGEEGGPQDRAAR